VPRNDEAPDRSGDQGIAWCQDNAMAPESSGVVVTWHKRMPVSLEHQQLGRRERAALGRSGLGR
jgi:hypothetical protein